MMVVKLGYGCSLKETKESNVLRNCEAKMEVERKERAEIFEEGRKG